MKEYTLKKKEAETLRINIGDESYQLPLMTSLTLEEAAMVETAEGTRSVLKKYIPILDELKITEMNEIVKIWRDVSYESAGRPLGE
jgi:hypothetical protein